MKIVIFTDGSMKHEIGAWAAHISYEGNEHLLSGKCPRFIKSSTQAETYAVLKAIQAVKSLEKEISLIEINTDLLGLKYRLFPNGKRTKNIVSKTLQDKIVSETFYKNIQLTVNFVRGHQKRNSGQEGALNYLVDLHARAQRKQYQKEQELVAHNKVNSLLEFLSFKYETKIFNNLAFYLSFLKI